MIKFPSLDQFRTAIKNVQYKARYKGRDEDDQPIFDPVAPLPTLSYIGTVKLHGTNAAIVWKYDKETNLESFEFQSRERVLTLQQDNAQFMLTMMGKNRYSNNDILDTLIEDIIITYTSFDMRFHDQFIESVAVFGEWCGEGIQKGIAISSLPKMFVIFAIKVNNQWVDLDLFRPGYYLAENNIYSIREFPTFKIDIDFNHPHLVQNQLIEITTKVGDQCPVGKQFGAEGIGEGVVWTSQTVGWQSYDFAFKVKDERHSVSKVKTLASVDVEKIKAINDFVDYAVTEQRLEQGIQNLVNEQLKPLEITSIGDFIRWVYNDVIKEETDTIVENQLDAKKLGGPIANRCRPWYVDRLNKGDA